MSPGCIVQDHYLQKKEDIYADVISDSIVICYQK